MSETSYRFPVVDGYTWRRMGVDPMAVLPNRTTVAESGLRLRREGGYGYIRALWWVRHRDGRAAVSVPPGAGNATWKLLGDQTAAHCVFDAETTDKLIPIVNEPLKQAGMREIDRQFRDIFFGCNAALLQRHESGDCRRLTDGEIPPAEGLELPSHCFPNGLVYGVIEDGVVATVAYAHRTGFMEDRVAELGVATAPAYRGRGFAKTAVSAVVEHITRKGGEARYCCRPRNHASIATARAVGFVLYGSSLVLGAPCTPET